MFSATIAWDHEGRDPILILPPHFAAIEVRLSFELVILLIMEEYAEMDGFWTEFKRILQLDMLVNVH